ncbi:23S rRNA (uracil(1939)-C(5))-methyltransferase RlmD [Thermococcus barophilus]|uniref:23S rRNA (Uracil(747)-C(5))-methyltransferase n=1 Tax=Thermococcus barophilus TaxID=55802 RepID=A0A0S1XBU5_THEBA|nr:23S rRNA (uracil(1939)-C(5))-methyltransferase RlmD [Thermococcus barophilus]ALM75251.1 23S rRNA (uracil(747)-C(5))-methyltransferase [Thermococcus barophilus]
MKAQGYIEEMSDEGLGVLKAEKPIYVPYTVVGDFVRVYTTRRRFGRYIAEKFEVVEFSQLRQSPRCMHFGKCGGCLWQHIRYKEQLKLKQENFRKITGIATDIKGSPKLFGFRNSSNFIVTTQGIGFKEYARPLSIVDVKECPVFSNKTWDYLKTLKEFMKEENLKAWDLKRKRGDVHYLSVREGKSTDEVMINLIAHIKPNEKLAEAFRDYFYFADFLYWSFKADKRDDPKGEPKLIAGKPYISERIGDVVYLIHPNSFFQANSYALPLLLKAAEGFTEGEKILDLYSGVGTFGIWLAKRDFKVEGVEANPFAVEMANKNAKLNGVDAVFRLGKAEETAIGDYDTAVVDPPRKGLKETAELLAKSNVENIIYVSCNPKAFKLDYENHLKKAYQIEDALLIDMFPHTPHVEAVVKLVRKV